MRMMIIVATPAKNIAIAPPDRSECSPISSFVKPRLSDPISPTTARSLGRAWAEFIHDIFPSDELKEHIFESAVAPGIFMTLFTVKAAARTGHKKASPLHCLNVKGSFYAPRIRND